MATEKKKLTSKLRDAELREYYWGGRNKNTTPLKTDASKLKKPVKRKTDYLNTFGSDFESNSYALIEKAKEKRETGKLKSVPMKEPKISKKKRSTDKDMRANNAKKKPVKKTPNNKAGKPRKGPVSKRIQEVIMAKRWKAL